jgi:hypothetical protein
MSVRIPRVRLTIRWMMVAVAIVGVVLGWVGHVRALMRPESEFGPSVLFLEGGVAAWLLAIVLWIGRLVRIVGKDDRASGRFAHDAVSNAHSISVDPPEPE